MSSIVDEVEQFVAERGPVDQDLVEEQYGREGLTALRKLMSQHRVSYSLEWDLVIEGGEPR